MLPQDAPRKGAFIWCHDARARRIGHRMQGLWRAGYYTMMLLMLCVCVAGCGGSHVGARTGPPIGIETSVHAYPTTYLRNDVQTLVRERVPGGHLSIIAEGYKYRGKVYFNLAHQSEPLYRRVKPWGGRGGGPSLEMAASGIAQIDVSYGCVGRYSYALAYGLLYNPGNIVTARTRGETIKFSKVTIPARFHSRGVLVYALLGHGPVQVLTRTPEGRILREEQYDEERATCHR